MSSNWNISREVIEIFSEVLEIDSDEITVDSKVVGELGADSLDIVDLSFSLGKKFGIKLPKKSMIIHAQEYMGNATSVVNNGKLTDLGVELLQKGPNAYRCDEIYPGQSLDDVFSDTKVSHWINLCEAIIESGLSGDELIQGRVKCIVSEMAA